jgi:hypothetical protein
LVRKDKIHPGAGKLMSQQLPDDVIKFLQAHSTTHAQLADSDLTTERAAEVWKVPYNTAKGRLERMVTNGKATKEHRSRQDAGNVTRRVTIYVIKQ